MQTLEQPRQLCAWRPFRQALRRGLFYRTRLMKTFSPVRAKWCWGEGKKEKKRERDGWRERKKKKKKKAFGGNQRRDGVPVHNPTALKNNGRTTPFVTEHDDHRKDPADARAGVRHPAIPRT